MPNECRRSPKDGFFGKKSVIAGCRVHLLRMWGYAGIGPLCHQLQMALKQQEKLVSTQNDAVVKVLTCTPDGPMLQAHCQLVKGMAGRVDLPEKLLMLLKVGPRIDASPGDFISIRKPWQSLEVDGVRVLLVQHADVNC